LGKFGWIWAKSKSCVHKNIRSPTAMHVVNIYLNLFHLIDLRKFIFNAFIKRPTFLYRKNIERELNGSYKLTFEIENSKSKQTGLSHYISIINHSTVNTTMTFQR